jgi:hypothetical protein
MPIRQIENRDLFERGKYDKIQTAQGETMPRSLEG